MDKYIATKPVRFDRNYEVGEEIPADVINPKMLNRLIEARKITVVTGPDETLELLNETVENSLEEIEILLGMDFGEKPDLGVRLAICRDKIIEIITPTGNTAESGTAQFTCSICGKVFSNKTGLSAHMKAHK